jgi:uncharacterized membrane protein YphA (DoxX/SURF4 family)
MKKTNILYWIFTALFAALMTFSSIPDILSSPEAVAFIGNLGYPKYFVPFIGVAKLLGVIAILIPGYPRIKEWAYAGLTFDLIAATYSQIAVNGFVAPTTFMFLPFGLCALSYIFYHNKLQSRS